MIKPFLPSFSLIASLFFAVRFWSFPSVDPSASSSLTVFCEAFPSGLSTSLSTRRLSIGRGEKRNLRYNKMTSISRNVIFMVNDDRYPELTQANTRRITNTSSDDSFVLTIPAETVTEKKISDDVFPLPTTSHHVEAIERKKTKNSKNASFFKSIDFITYVAYVCNVLAVSIPIILLPLAVSDIATSAGGPSVSATVASVASVATLGGAIGKFVNGFVCQRFGSYKCSRVYLVGIALSSLLFSFAGNTRSLSLAYAGIEFCASIQWTSLAIMVTNYYARAPKKVAGALTVIGLASPGGAILAKTLGPILASVMDWRAVARVGSIIALFGSITISQAPIQPFQNESMQRLQQKASTQPIGSWIISARSSAKALLSSRLFWMLASAHSMAFVVRGIDRILGTFFSDITGLSRTLTGGLTLSTTIGLFCGLVSASKTFPRLEVEEQHTFLKRRYMLNVGATFGIACTTALTNVAAMTSTTGKIVLSTLLALFSSIMSANVAFQFYQFPTIIAKSFVDHKEVCISWLDAIGFFLAAPVFASIGKIVPRFGWVSTWAILTVLFGSAWALMLQALPPVLAKEKEANSLTR